LEIALVAAGYKMTVDLNLGFIKKDDEKIMAAKKATRVTMNNGFCHLNKNSKIFVESKFSFSDFLNTIPILYQ